MYNNALIHSNTARNPRNPQPHSIEIQQSAFPDFNYSDPLVDKEEETDDYPSVNVIHKSNKGAIYGGGEFAKFNNLFSLTQDTFTALINPGDSSVTTPAFAKGDIYYECNKRGEKLRGAKR